MKSTLSCNPLSRAWELMEAGLGLPRSGRVEVMTGGASVLKAK